MEQNNGKLILFAVEINAFFVQNENSEKINEITKSKSVFQLHPHVKHSHTHACAHTAQKCILINYYVKALFHSLIEKSTNAERRKRKKNYIFSAKERERKVYRI